MDRFLSTFTAERLPKVNTSLVLLGCLFIATKMESRLNSFSITDLIYLFSDYQLEPQTLVTTESMILNTLDWNVNLQTPYHYIEQVVFALTPGHRTSPEHTRDAQTLLEIAMFALDVALVSPLCAPEKPADLTFAAANLAFIILEIEPLPESAPAPQLHSPSVRTATCYIAQAWVRLVYFHNLSESMPFLATAPSHVPQKILEPNTLARITNDYNVSYPPTLND